MTRPSADQETRAAAELLAQRLKNRDPETDDDAFAMDFMTALRGRGWRATEARKAPDWRVRQDAAPASGNADYQDARRKILAAAENAREAAATTVRLAEEAGWSPLAGHTLEAE